MSDASLDIVILGLTITSSWGNGHATTYRALIRELENRGHRLLFLERDMPWYAANRDLPSPPYGTTALYDSFDTLRDEHAHAVQQADMVIVGSYVPDGIEVGDWVLETATGITAFYDIDTPVTLDHLERGECDYLAVRQIADYQLYLSFAGGRVLEILERRYHSPMARPLYCSVDTTAYRPEAPQEMSWDLGYMGTYSDDRQPPLEQLMLEAARRLPEQRFVVAGPRYPSSVNWPNNVERIEHLPPDRHSTFYNAQRFTLNITRAAMRKLGWSPSVRLFEAAACAVPVISDYWEGLDEFFTPGEEILISRNAEETMHILQNLSEEERLTIGERGRRCVMKGHTAVHRAMEVEKIVLELRAHQARESIPRPA